jgi:hypothetical protein
LRQNNVYYLRVAVRSLRQNMERDAANPKLIINEPSVGFRLAEKLGSFAVKLVSAWMSAIPDIRAIAAFPDPTTKRTFGIAVPNLRFAPLLSLTLAVRVSMPVKPASGQSRGVRSSQYQAGEAPA